MDQVGVNAPGSPTMMTFLSAMRSARLKGVGGHLAASTSTDGNWAPTEMERRYNESFESSSGDEEEEEEAEDES